MKSLDVARIAVAGLGGAVLGAALPGLAVMGVSAEIVVGVVFAAKEYLEVKEKQEDAEQENS